MKVKTRAAVIVASTLIGAGVTAGPALATNYNIHYWGILSAGSYAKGYGHVYNNSYVQVENSSYQYQVENGDNGAYVRTNYLYWENGYDCGYSQAGDPIGCWYPKSSSDYQTKRTTSHSWVWGATYEGFAEYGTSVRSIVKVCEDISWWPDTCSGAATITFSY